MHTLKISLCTGADIAYYVSLQVQHQHSEIKNYMEGTYIIWYRIPAILGVQSFDRDINHLHCLCFYKKKKHIV